MEMTVCRACATAEKEWEGGDRKCGFANGAAFSGGNWMCATVQMIREMFWNESPGPGQHSRFPHSIFVTFSDDQWTASIDLSAIELTSGSARTLWVSWYKSRGRTEAMWLLDENEAPRRPTEADILAIAEGFKL